MTECAKKQDFKEKVRRISPELSGLNKEERERLSTLLLEKSNELIGKNGGNVNLIVYALYPENGNSIVLYFGAKVAFDGPEIAGRIANRKIEYGLEFQKYPFPGPEDRYYTYDLNDIIDVLIGSSPQKETEEKPGQTYTIADIEWRPLCFSPSISSSIICEIGEQVERNHTVYLEECRLCPFREENQ